MSIDVDKSFDVREQGIATRDNDDNVKFYFTSSPGDPSGSPAPINTLVFREDLQLLYYKFGAGDNDWRQLRAADLTFDPSTTDLTATNIQAAIAQLANRHYGKDADENTVEFDDTTSGSAFSVYATLNFNVSDTSNVNTYRLNSDFFWGHNSASNDIRVRAVLDGTPIKELRVEPKDAGADQRIQNNLLFYATNLTQGAHTLELEYRPASASRVSRMFRAELEVWRTK